MAPKRPWAPSAFFFRHQVINLAPPKGDSPLRLEESQSWRSWHECQLPETYVRHPRPTATKVRTHSTWFMYWVTRPAEMHPGPAARSMIPKRPFHWGVLFPFSLISCICNQQKLWCHGEIKSPRSWFDNRHSCKCKISTLLYLFLVKCIPYHKMVLKKYNLRRRGMLSVMITLGISSLMWKYRYIISLCFNWWICQHFIPTVFLYLLPPPLHTHTKKGLIHRKLIQRKIVHLKIKLSHWKKNYLKPFNCVQTNDLWLI